MATEGTHRIEVLFNESSWLFSPQSIQNHLKATDNLAISQNLELEVLGISNHLKSGFRNGGQGLLIDKNGKYVFNPGLSANYNLYRKYNSKGNAYVSIFGKIGALADCNLGPLGFFGPGIRLAWKISRNYSIELNISLLMMISKDWGKSSISYSPLPLIYPVINYHDQDKTVGYAGSFSPQNTGLAPTSGSSIWFSFLKLSNSNPFKDDKQSREAAKFVRIILQEKDFLYNTENKDSNNS